MFPGNDALLYEEARGSRSRAAATSKRERSVIIVNGWKPLTIITKCSILDVATVLDPPLEAYFGPSQTSTIELFL